MSTNQQRLKSAIQRIARSDPQIRSLLKAVETRGSIPGSSASASNDAEQDRQCCDGSVADGSSGGSGSDATVGTDTRLPDNGGQSGLNGDNAADLGDVGGGSLDGLTDCETGQPVKFDGSDWIPPEGWDSPTEPPVDPTYEEGYYWTYGYDDNGDGKHPTASDAASVLSSGGVKLVSGTLCDYFLATTDDGDDSTGVAHICKHTCDPGDDFSACNPSEEDIIAKNWPRDGKVSLAAKNGAIVGSKYDPENNGDYSKPKSEISLCDENGNQVNIKPNATGGWKSIDPATNGGDGYMYDSTGKQIARISGSEYSDPNI